MSKNINEHSKELIIETQSELSKAKEELAQLKAEYQEFVYIVSHDLSAPLRQIEGFSEMVLDKHKDDFDDKTKRHFEFIVKGGNTIRNILDDLTLYSRLSTKENSYTELDINNIISNNLKNLSSLIENTKAIVNSGNMPKINGDEELISQVFYHLLHNALYYQLPNQVPNINLSFIELNDHWQFCITDNGIGIPDNISDKIFKMFRRGVSEKQYPGSGTGLTFAKKIIIKHQGEIWFESEKGKGSSFYFTLRKM